MPEVIEIDLDALDPDLLAGLKRLTEPRFYPCFQKKDPWDIPEVKIIAIAALEDGKPVGLALASHRTEVQMARLVSLFVQEQYRGKHMGKALLSRMEETLRREKCRLVNYLYLIEQPTTEALEKLMAGLGWSKPRLMMVKCHFDCYAFNPPWFRRDYPVPKGFEMFPWNELKAKERAQLHMLVDQGTIPLSVSPFYDEKTIDYNTSLGLRNAKEVVGWMINHRADQQTIQYSSLYIHREYKYLGHSMCLLVNSIRRQQRTPMQWSVLELNVQEADSHWIAFVKRRLIPYTIKVERLNESVRLL